MKSYIKFLFNVSVDMKITGQLSEEGALQISNRLVSAVQILAGGLALAALIAAIGFFF